jgi:hypothetical protein
MVRSIAPHQCKIACLRPWRSDAGTVKLLDAPDEGRSLTSADCGWHV